MMNDKAGSKKCVIASKQSERSNLSNKTAMAEGNDEVISANNEQIVTPPSSAHNDGNIGQIVTPAAHNDGKNEQIILFVLSSNNDELPITK